MCKQEFLESLRERLSGLPREDVEERLTFYSEMIDDRMEEGLSEEAAVQAVGSIDEIVADVAQTKQMTVFKKQWKAWEIVLLVLSSPVWLSLLSAAFVVVLSLYVSLWAVEVSLWGCAVGFAAGGIVLAVGGQALTGVAMIGAAIMIAGLSIFLFYVCKLATKGIVLLTGKIFAKCFAGKEHT